MWVGRPAPPRPTHPEMRTASQKLRLSRTFGGITCSLTACSPSGSMTTALQSLPFKSRCSSTAVTVPETGEWIGAAMSFTVSPMKSPTLTLSPFLTIGRQGAPMPISIGTVIFSGSGSSVQALSCVPLL